MVPVAAVASVVLADTDAWSVQDPLGRDYPVWVALPAGYADQPHRRYPVLYLTDALYTFPLARSVRDLVGLGGANLEDVILVGLPPQQGLSSRQSRSRDYTPSTPVRAPGDAYSNEVSYGGAAHYRDFLADGVLPAVDARYRTDPARRAFAGHSYGGLLGTYMLLTRPAMFQTYLLSSPSLWFDHHIIDQLEQTFAQQHRALHAQVLFAVGGKETIAPGAVDAPRNDLLRDTRQFVERLRQRGYEGLQLDNQVIDGEDHLTVFPGMLTRALLQFFPGSGRR